MVVWQQIIGLCFASFFICYLLYSIFFFFIPVQVYVLNRLPSTDIFPTPVLPLLCSILCHFLCRQCILSTVYPLYGFVRYSKFFWLQFSFRFRPFLLVNHNFGFLTRVSMTYNLNCCFCRLQISDQLSNPCVLSKYQVRPLIVSEEVHFRAYIFLYNIYVMKYFAKYTQLRIHRAW
jgi:hypothetical protein